jgi:hypothetical protein
MITIEGADQLARLAKQLKEAGDKGLQAELGKAINRALKPVKADIKQSAATMLPKRGGLAAKVAKSRITIRRRTGRTAGVRLVATNTISLYHLDKGIIRHRKGGDIDAGKVQPTEPGWMTKPAEAAAPKVRAELVQAMDDIAKKIVRGV